MKKKWIVVGVIAVLVIVIAVAAAQTTKRVEYHAGDLLISIDSADPEGLATIDFMKQAAEGTGINVIALDPSQNPKGIPLTDEANMEVLGAMLFFNSDGDHIHEVRVHDEGYITNLEDAQKIIQYIMGGDEPQQ